MKPPLAAYARAHGRVAATQADLTAAFGRHGIEPGPPPNPAWGDEPADITQARAQFAQAGEELRQAEEPLAEVIAKAWEANRQAVVDAHQGAVEARLEQARIEVECGNAARHRDPVHPILNEDERARVVAARQATSDAKQRLNEIADRFKAGVTAEQMET